MRTQDIKVYCMSFGEDIKKDTQAGDGKVGMFIARDAPPGGCPAP